MKQHKHFAHRLESLRGLAALLVVLHHALLMIDLEGYNGKIARALQGIFYGHGAVICFFVLSGLVLGESLRRMKEVSLSTVFGYYAKRLFRIYPAYLASLIICALLLSTTAFWKSDSFSATAFYKDLYGAELSLRQFVGNVFLLDYSLNPVSWSLAVEMVGSALLPILHLASRVRPLIAPILLGLFMFQLFENQLKSPFVAYLPYLWMFYLGYLIPVIPQCMWVYLERKRRLLAALLSLAILVCLFTQHFGNHIIPYTLSVSLMVGAIFRLPHSSFFSLLDRRILKFYGRISYSLYLFHFPVIYLVAGYVYRSAFSEVLEYHPGIFCLGMGLAALIISTPFSMLSYRLIEERFISYGKAFSHRRKFTV